jgi:hypothetical protein
MFNFAARLTIQKKLQIMTGQPPFASVQDRAPPSASPAPVPSPSVYIDGGLHLAAFDARRR